MRRESEARFAIPNESGTRTVAGDPRAAGLSVSQAGVITEPHPTVILLATQVGPGGMCCHRRVLAPVFPHTTKVRSISSPTFRPPASNASVHTTWPPAAAAAPVGQITRSIVRWFTGGQGHLPVELVGSRSGLIRTGSARAPHQAEVLTGVATKQRSPGFQHGACPDLFQSFTGELASQGNTTRSNGG